MARFGLDYTGLDNKIIVLRKNAIFACLSDINRKLLYDHFKGYSSCWGG